MAKVKYIEEPIQDSTGHEYNLMALNTASLQRSGGQIFISGKFVAFKDHESLISGKSPSMETRKETFYESDLTLSPVELNNLIVEALAKKHDLKVIEVEEKLESLSPKEQEANNGK